MATEAQLNANRQNAKKSTGPRTPLGKIISSRNAVTHGFSGRLTLLTDDEALLYSELLERYILEMEPATLIEEELLKTIADCNWQLNKIRAAEELTMHDLCTHEEVTAGGAVLETALTRAIRRDFVGVNICEKLDRHRAHFHRTLNQALKEFDRRKAARLAATHSDNTVADLKSQRINTPIGFDLQTCDTYQFHTAHKASILDRRIPAKPEVDPKVDHEPALHAA